MGKIPLVPLPRHTEPNPVTNAISSFSYSFGLLQKKLMLLLAVEPVTTYKQLPIKEGGVTNKVLLIKQEKNASLWHEQYDDETLMSEQTFIFSDT